MLGPPPYIASAEQMRILPPCQTCAEMSPGSGAAARDVAGRRGDVCESCFMERPLIGTCPNCGDE